MADIEKERFEALMRDKWPEAPLDGVCSVRAWEAWQAAKAEAQADLEAQLADTMDGLRTIALQEQQIEKLEADVRELVEVLEELLNAESTYPYGGMSQSEVAAIQKACTILAKHKGQT